jgi:hypothetical protein
MPSTDVPRVQAYRASLEGTATWLLRSERPKGGSAAHYAPLLGWSRAYPETTGYIVPTLLRLADALREPAYEAAALRLGEWLLSVRNADGSWNGGLHPPKRARPSVFNTGQVLKGMLALWQRTLEPRWQEAAVAGESWLRRGMGADGLWPGGDYRAPETPSYYTHVLWPMLAVSQAAGDPAGAVAVRRGLERVLARRRPNGVIAGWGFAPGSPAFTHTIAYTLRGIQECGRLLQDSAITEAARPALEVLLRRSELVGGRLAGAFDEAWKPVGRYVCLTGNVQLARCLLILEESVADLRLVSGAARLTDVVVDAQRLTGSSGVRGGVAGSAPLHGAYMRFRYPNWAAKYHCDALLALLDRLERV